MNNNQDNNSQDKAEGKQQNKQGSVSADQFAQPRVSKKKSLSPVWILPIVALLIGLSLIVKSYLNAGIMITVQVESAEGLEIEKTKVLYKGIVAGVVKKYEITNDLQKVILHIEMNKRTEPFLNDSTQFWVVEPRISLSGVSGLDTIIGGRYIAIDTTDSGKPKRHFEALNYPPPPSIETPGLHIKLRLNRLASVDRGTVIYYKQLPIGEVTNYTLEENDTEIHVWVLIKPEFAHLVKENSLFYNVSGLKVQAGLSGVKIETESIVSMLAGGIAMYNPEKTEPVKSAQHGAFYLLYDDFESAQIGIPLILRFKDVSDIIEKQTEIRYQGRKVGRIGQFSYDKETNETVVVAHIMPRLEEALTENTQFWIVKPSVSLLKIIGLDALLSGNYIEMRPSMQGKKSLEFRVSEDIPALSISTPGLHFVLETETLGSIDKGVPLLYKNITVGNIEGFQLSDDAKKVQLKAYIKPEFSHLVKKNTRFYNVSGLNISGNVSGIKVQTESLKTLLAGGIAFYTPDSEPEEPESQNDDVFKLYDDFEEAKAGIEIQLILENLTGISEGNTKIIYKGAELGNIQKIVPNKGKGTATAYVVMNPMVENALVEDTKFWIVKPKISMAGINNLETLFAGNYITARVGNSTKKKRIFKVLESRPPLDHNAAGLHLKLTSKNLGSVTIGSPIMYQRIKIGDVQDYELADDRKRINILIHIWPQYSDMISRSTRFYNASGFEVNASLSGIEVRTESIDSILNGGIAIYNEESNSTATEKVKNGTLYTLFKDFEAAKRNAYYVTVQFNSPHGLSVGSQVMYRGLQVGDVQMITLDDKNPGTVLAKLELDSSLKPLLGKNSRFWVSKAKLGLARTENLGNLIKGNAIHIDPVEGPFTQSFVGLGEKPLNIQVENAFAVSLTASRLSSIKVGDPVYYRQIKVGEVIAYELADTADQILIHLKIRNRFKPLIRENSKFWHASGIALDVSLFGTSKIRTESLESIIAGGIAFATPDNDKMGKMLPSGSFFVLHDEPKEEWSRWNPIIHLNQETQQN